MGSAAEVRADIRRMAATPHPIKHNGETYFLSPFGVKELAEFEDWASRRPFEKLRDKLRILEKLKLKSDPAASLIEAAEKASTDPLARASEMNSVAGAKMALFICFKKKHPDMTDELFEEILEENGLDTLQQIMDGQNSIPDSKPKN